MATGSSNPKIRPVLDRIQENLDALIGTGGVLAGDDSRPVKLVKVSRLVPALIPIEQSPSIFIHAGSIDPPEEWTGAHELIIPVVLSLVENYLDPDESMDHAYDYIDELWKYVFAGGRQWLTGGVNDLNITTTNPGGVAFFDPEPIEDLYTAQADMTMFVLRQFDFY